jgi:hypothetical protein
MTASLKSKWAKKESGETAALFRAASAARSRACQERRAFPPSRERANAPQPMVNDPVTIRAHSPLKAKGN